MASINILPRHLAERIAAGEVCERPASVVKELLENAVDAGANKITVELRAGGIKYIRITDNGCGIAREDVPKAFLSHATSKIRTEGDLDAIATLGFRGEALASVCAVSRTELLTRTAGAEFGTRYVIEGGEEQLIDDAGCPEGTTILVRDLFYNTPARMKFLKKDATEGNYVSDVVAKAALSHPDISFRLIKDDKQTLFTPGDGDLRGTVAAVYDREFASTLLPCSYSLDGVEISGLISKPLSARPNRNMQHFFTNLRYVKIPFAAAALDQAYKNSIMVGKFPSAVLFITVPPHTVDVNVHPAKTEVRFADERRVFDAVFYAVKSALGKGDTRADFTFAEKKQVQGYQTFLERQAPFEQGEMRLPPTAPIQPKQEIFDASRVPVIPAFAHSAAVVGDSSELRDAELRSTGISYDTALEDPPLVIPPQAPAVVAASQSFVAPSTDAEDDWNEFSPEDEDSFSSPALPQNTPSVITDTFPKPSEKAAPPAFRVLGEIFETYILVESGEALLLIDKHAAHERMLFDTLRSTQSAPAPQSLLAPVTVTLSRREYAEIMENLPLLADAGYAVEDFGEGTVLVRECPQGLPYSEIAPVIEELAGYLCEHVREPLPEKLDWLYHNTACRAAVKAGTPTEPYELQDFVGKVLSDPNLRYCPHGRPVTVEVSRRTIEKQFGRV